MTLSAHQACYLPWLGYFNKLAHCDTFVVLDSAALSGVDRHNWTYRCLIAGDCGEKVLSVPLRRKGMLGCRMDAVEIDGDEWRDKHLWELERGYPSCPIDMTCYIPRKMRVASDLAQTAQLLAGVLRIDARWAYQSRLNIRPAGEDMLLDLCRYFNADRFLFGRNGRDYVTPEKWKTAGIEPVFQDFHVPAYPRRGVPTERILSVVDCIANAGLEYTREVVCG